MDPARMFTESLTASPELENSQGHTRLARTGGRFGQVRYAPESGNALMSPPLDDLLTAIVTDRLTTAILDD